MSSSRARSCASSTSTATPTPFSSAAALRSRSSLPRSDSNPPVSAPPPAALSRSSPKLHLPVESYEALKLSAVFSAFSTRCPTPGRARSTRLSWKASPIASRIVAPDLASTCATSQSRSRAVEAKRLSSTGLAHAPQPVQNDGLGVSARLDSAQRDIPGGQLLLAPTRAAGARPAPGAYGLRTGSIR